MQSIIHFFQVIFTLNGSFDWSYVSKYLFSQYILKGAVITVILAVLAQLVGSILGLVLYLMRRGNPALQAIAGAYIWLFRGTPLLVQIFILYNVIPYLGLVKPLQSIHIFDTLGFTNVPFDSFLAAFIALSLNEGAYMSEIVRAGIDSIDVGQTEAAKSLGMTYGLTMRRIILPQAARVIIPPLGNEFNNMLKTTSLATVIALTELLGSAQNIINSTFRPLELLVVASFWYLIMTTLWSFVQAYLERHFNASTNVPTISLWDRLLGRFSRGPGETATEVAISNQAR